MSEASTPLDLNGLPSFLRQRFQKRLAGLKKKRLSANTRDKIRKTLAADLEQAKAVARQRAADWPTIDWQDSRWAGLPVVAELERLKQAISDNQVVVVAGETGSGKTTQLPKICLELGLGKEGLIGHTQPRRLAARQVAGRIAEELGGPVGQQVGYRVRFDDRSGDHNLICLLTDGMLLAELQQDRLLSRYQVLIIDEAHERSLNIDFLLGFLKQLLPKRPDLKVIITSATIDHQRFADFFGAQAMEVAGRSYPVEVCYRPADEQTDLPRQLLAVIEEIEAEERRAKQTQRLDILVFLAGEGDIREAHHFLKKAELFATEILPLYARLSAKDQARVFASHSGRRVVLATNVAETSLTVPGIGYVVDAGTARISRYSVASKVQRLPVEAVSKASANQRAGRAGRLMPGVCFRLYDEQDFISRPDFTDPEIRRTNLAAVILTMADLRLGDIEQFPFLDAPDGRLIRDGRKLLYELGALDQSQRLTPLGRELARFPLDPRLSRMLFSAKDLGVLSELLVIVAVLAVQDPCERPPDKRQQADQSHRLFRDKRSDFLFYWNLWCWAEQQRGELSRNQYAKLLKRRFLSPRRMQEWRDIHRQLLQQVREKGWTLNVQKLPEQPEEKQSDGIDFSSDIDYEGVHRALLSGLATLIMRRDDEGEWLSCRNRKPLLWPGSALRKSKSAWLMAAEQVETSRLFGRTLAQIKPEWVIDAVPQLLKYDYSEPHWSKRREAVMAYESIALFGLQLASGKRVSYARFDKPLARQLMISEALVEGSLKQSLSFVEKNLARRRQLEVVEHKLRRRDYLVDEEAQAVFYDEQLPADIHDLRELRHWYKQADKNTKERLLMTDNFLLARDAGGKTAELPDELEVDGMRLALRYQFDPSGKRDGVTLVLPQALLDDFPRWRADWLVPGLLQEKIEALLRGLPKQQRRQVVPVPDYAQALVEALQPCEPLLPALTRELQRMTGLRVEQEDWPLDKLPDWLRMNIRLVDDAGKRLKESRHWEAFDGMTTPQAAATPKVLVSSIGGWAFGDLPASHEQQLAGTTITRYPVLRDERKQVVLVALNDALDATHQHAQGVARLLMLTRPEVTKHLRKLAASLPGFQKLTAEKSLFASQALDNTLQHLLCQALGLLEVAPYSEAQWQALLQQRLGDAVAACEEGLCFFSALYVGYRDIRVRLNKNFPLQLAHVHADINTQLDDLFHADALGDWPHDWWQAMPRYLETIDKRLANLDKEDRGIIAELAAHREQYLIRAAGKPFWQQPEPLKHYRLMLEELRVSLFAQQLGTQMSVSFKRLNKQWLEC